MPSPAAASRTLSPRPLRTSPPSRTGRRLLAVTSLGLAGLIVGLLSGCATAPVASSPGNSYAQISGNWQFTSSDPASARLSSLGGSLTVGVGSSEGQGTSVTGILHPLAANNQCLPTSTVIPVTGSIDNSSHLTLSSSLNGATLTISGTLSADRRSLTAPTYTISGGSCATPAFHAVIARDSGTPITAQQYQPVNGTYAGTLTTGEGETFSLTSTLTQTSQPDANGVYHVTGTAASPNNNCVPSTLPATASTIDGGSIITTYTDAATGATITGAGTTSPDGKTIAITNWTISSPCGSDTGSGTLTLQ